MDGTLKEEWEGQEVGAASIVSPLLSWEEGQEDLHGDRKGERPG